MNSTRHDEYIFHLDLMKIDYTFINIEFMVQWKKLSRDVLDSQKISGESLMSHELFITKLFSIHFY